MELVCVRHAATAWNREGRFHGHTDLSLDPTGLAQALSLARELRHIKFHAAVTSDLRRAVQTAEAILAGRHIGLRVDRRLREMYLGSWEGLTWAEITRANLGDCSDRESFDALKSRVHTFLCDLAGIKANDPILIVTHSGVIQAIRELLAPGNAALEPLQIEPGSVIRLMA